MVEQGFKNVIRSRKSVRAFTSDPVSRDTIEGLLALARTAPSGANLQPGNFIVLGGSALDSFKHGLKTIIESGEEESAQYSYFPEPMPKHLRNRQVKLGAEVYAALGIDRKDHAEREKQFMRNYQFFDAPVGIIATIDSRMGSGCFMDFGMVLQTLFLGICEQGLGGCGIGAFANYGPAISRLLDFDQHEIVVCGIAIGHEDPNAAINKFRSQRLPVDKFSRFEGWQDFPYWITT